MSCRIKSIKPICSYKVDGISSIMALDSADFNGLRFEGDDLYKNCLVTAILRSGEFIEIDTPDSAKYSSTLQNGIYTHTLETFIGELSAEMITNLHLATKRRYLVLFKTKAGRNFCFGYEAGASLSYTNQTTDGTGSLVTITASSIYPLFEVIDDAPNYTRVYQIDYNTAICEEQIFNIDINNSYCETI